MTDSTDKVESQINKFKEAARKLETDDDEARFDEKLRRIANAPKKTSESGNGGKCGGLANSRAH